jgi:hypothetical protein
LRLLTYQLIIWVEKRTAIGRQIDWIGYIDQRFIDKTCVFEPDLGIERDHRYPDTPIGRKFADEEICGFFEFFHFVVFAHGAGCIENEGDVVLLLVQYGFGIDPNIKVLFAEQACEKGVVFQNR